MSLRLLVPSLASLALLCACGGPKQDPPSEGTGAAQDGGEGAGSEDTGSEASGEEAGPVELEAIAPAGEHPFSVLDMLEVDRVGSPTLSPDGRYVAYTLRETDMAANKGRTSLWVADVEAGKSTQLDAHPKGASSPNWSPDGKYLYFLSSRSGSSQVWRLTLEGGTAGALVQLSELPVDVSSLVVAPDGAHLALSAELFPDCPDLACTAERLKARAADPRTGRAYDRMFVRHWDQWKDGRRAHLITVEAREGVDAAVIVSKGLDADVPSKPFGGAEEITFTPDGAGLVFAARDAGGGPGEPWSTNFDLFYAPVDGGAAPSKLSANPAWDTAPQFSPDGEQLAWLAMERPGFEADRMRLMVQAWDGAALGGEPRAVTQGWDRSISSFVFAPDGERVFATAQSLGHKPLFEIDLDSGEAKERVSKKTVASPDAGGDRLIWLAHDLQHPAELFAAKLGGEDGDQITHHNDALMDRTKLGEAEQFSFTGAGGDTVYGWVVEPVDFDPEQRYPVAFLIHGGPQGSFGNKFHHRWNPQAYAGAGYATVMIDFHGSTGYGQDFTDAISGDWGGKPLEDLQKGLAHALEAYPWLDGAKVCALGASYGGYMINWIAGNWPDRFACLVNHDGIFDNRMMYYATEELWFPEWEHGGPEFEVPEAYAEHNPADHVGNWQTPMLVVHGSLDYRVPLEQGLATFTALQRQGIDSRFLHFPDENHWVLSPANSKQWHGEVLAWLDAHLK